ncbi:MAG: glutamate-5-semialdehyde dehydrogenase [Planctomycetes bacterium]|nr:glutamate-5-semialdehyde dehydrogenase [Planctomycetota bacterium]
MSTPADVEALARLAKSASRRLASLETGAKNAVIEDVAAELLARTPEILEANAADTHAARQKNLEPSKLKRLELTGQSLARLALGLRQLITLPDPIGAVTEEKTVPSGLRVRRVRVPLGVILMIYEARPGVTIDAFALCFKAGNACILKGGREAERSNTALAAIVHRVLEKHGIPREALTLVRTIDESDFKSLLQCTDSIDLVIPRGGEGLIRFVAANSRIPTIQHYKGVCHIFVDESADQARAIDVCVNAKVSAPATCNAAECILVHKNIVHMFLPGLDAALAKAGVEVRADARALPHLQHACSAGSGDFGREFLDMIVAVKVVDGVSDAIAHIAAFGSRHTEAILSASEDSIRAFRAGVDASCVIVNASTRFNDGFELGLGAEIGISTSKLHSYGPMGLEDLTARRFEVSGDFQTR